MSSFKKDLVSVVIPVYNVDNYIQNTIESVIKQTYKEIEVIIINDGSTDGTENIILKLIEKHDNIKYYYQPNKGVSAARNYGVSMSVGKFIAFLDGDDLWRSTKIEKQLCKMQTDNSNACYCGYTIFKKTNTIHEEINNYLEGNIFISSLKGLVKAWTCTWVIDKNIISKNKLCFTEGYNWAEDTEFFLKIMAITKVSVVQESLALLRIRDNSLTNYNEGFSSYKVQVVLAYKRLQNWIEQNTESIENSNLAISIIKDRLLPTESMNYLFKSKLLKKDLSEFIDESELKTYINNYAFSLELSSLKFMGKKHILKLLNILWR